MSVGRRFAAFFFPPRAATQTWMMLTFALFVGVAVLAVALYVFLVLRSNAYEALEQTLYAQASRVGNVLETAEGDEPRIALLESASRLMQVRFVLQTSGGQRIVVQDGRRLRHVAGALQTLPTGAERAVRRLRDPLTGVVMHVAVLRLSSGEVLEIGQPTPPLYEVVERMLVTVMVGMVMALLMAMLGAWVAAQQVTRPLTQITAAARAILEGEYTRKIALESRSAEFQGVAHNLNRMSDAFRTKIAELERLAHMQGEFIGNVSHEVRNPIFAVGGYLEALASDTLPSEQRKRYAEKAIAALGRLQNLFNDLIEIARLEYREDLIRASVFNMQELIEEVDEMLRPKAVEKGLILELENPTMFVRADRNRIRQVVTNLIENAIAYTDEGTVRCRVRRRLDKARIEVIDTGKGIPEESLERIFERFYRVDPDRSRKSGGTGLGLSIVRQILQAHGEAIHVESTLGRGTRFWFELPIADAPESSPAWKQLDQIHSS